MQTMINLMILGFSSVALAHGSQTATGSAGGEEQAAMAPAAGEEQAATFQNDNVNNAYSFLDALRTDTVLAQRMEALLMTDPFLRRAFFSSILGRRRLEEQPEPSLDTETEEQRRLFDFSSAFAPKVHDIFGGANNIVPPDWFSSQVDEIMRRYSRYMATGLPPFRRLDSHEDADDKTTEEALRELEELLGDKMFEESAGRRRFWNDISDTVADWTNNAVSDAADWTSNAASDAADWTSNAAEAAFVDAPSEVVDWTVQTGEDFPRFLSWMHEITILPFVTGWAKFQKGFSQMPFFTAGRRRIWDDISSGLSDAADWAVDAGDDVAKQASNAATTLGMIRFHDEIVKMYAPLMRNPFFRQIIMNNPTLRSFFVNRRLEAEPLEEDGGSDLVQRLMGHSA